ncbi:MAG TPA: macro domain-containing protein [Nitriliruptorales bacterium]|nr:macro domain-containing protein [Nitriliruptorales bacterium]
MADQEHGRREVSDATVVAVTGDLTREDVDAIVNAANERLEHGGGVAAAIVRAGGPAIQEESDRWVEEHGALEPGTAAVTSGGDLSARWVVHVAGPVYDRHDADENERLLRTAVRAALDAAASEGARSVALPAISAGVYGYPPEEATAVIASEVVSWLGDHTAEPVQEVRLIGIDDATARDFASGLERA